MSRDFDSWLMNINRYCDTDPDNDAATTPFVRVDFHLRYAPRTTRVKVWRGSAAPKCHSCLHPQADDSETSVYVNLQISRLMHNMSVSEALFYTRVWGQNPAVRSGNKYFLRRTCIPGRALNTLEFIFPGKSYHIYKYIQRRWCLSLGEFSSGWATRLRRNSGCHIYS